jgi:hypothetical protein
MPCSSRTLPSRKYNAHAHCTQRPFFLVFRRNRNTAEPKNRPAKKQQPHFCIFFHFPSPFPCLFSLYPSSSEASSIPNPVPTFPSPSLATRFPSPFLFEAADDESKISPSSRSHRSAMSSNLVRISSLIAENRLSRSERKSSIASVRSVVGLGRASVAGKGGEGGIVFGWGELVVWWRVVGGDVGWKGGNEERSWRRRASVRLSLLRVRRWMWEMREMGRGALGGGGCVSRRRCCGLLFCEDCVCVTKPKPKSSQVELRRHRCHVRRGELRSTRLYLSLAL